ncbi:MAG: transporter [Deltaproteobacteria bacterium]|nr:transporter [Deltaproteobacteria bacterium]
MRKLFLTAAALVPLVLPALSQADNLARDYLPAPPGTNLMIFYDYHVSSQDIYHDGDKIDGAPGISGDVYIFRPVYYHSYGFLQGASQVLFFMKDVQIDGVGEISGLSDMLFSPTFFLWNNTASKSYLGLVLHTTVPIGKYDEDRAGLSPGENVWKIKPELNFSQGIGDKLYVEVTGASQFTQKNKDWGDSEKEVAPAITIEAHASYDVAKALTVAANYWAHFGGETKIDGDKQDDKLNNHTLGVSLHYGLAPSNQLLVSYQYDVKVKEGPQYQTLALRFLHAF